KDDRPRRALVVRHVDATLQAWRFYAVEHRDATPWQEAAWKARAITSLLLRLGKIDPKFTDVPRSVIRAALDSVPSATHPLDVGPTRDAPRLVDRHHKRSAFV